MQQNQRHRPPAWRAWCATAAALVLGGAATVPAAIVPTSNATTLAQQIAQTPAWVTGAALVAVPPSGTPNATADTSLTGFPTDGTGYTILSSGNATLASTANNSGSSGADDSGPSVRGNSDFDVTILRVDLAVPVGANCLSLDFRFLSDEFPEYVGSAYNDAFIAELDTSTWSTSGSTITAPNNFAFDPSSNVISINAAGVTSMSAANASGTTYDGATPLLTASTPITPGAHSLYLSIFDQGDHIYDSAVFLDHLVLGTTAPGGCQPGATVVAINKVADASTVLEGGVVGYTITIPNPSAIAITVSSISDTLPPGFSYTTGSTTGVTTADPGIVGQLLTWTGPFTLPGNSSITLHFNGTAAPTPDRYYDNASATAVGVSVTPTGPTAPIDVIECTTTANCNDNDACTTDSCDTAAGAFICVHAPVNCTDANACTNDFCDTMLGCQHPVQPDCVPCGSDADCPDANVCDGFDHCVNGTCQTDPAPNCDDRDACTTDGCDPQAGCTHVAVSCDDQNGCTNDVCTDQGGVAVCSHPPNSNSCDDGNVCTSGDVCSNGGCAGTAVPGCCTSNTQCNDGDACTTDTCAANVCQHAPVTGLPPETACGDMVDNDCDGLVDCNDLDCNGVSPCPKIRKDPSFVRFGKPGIGRDAFTSHGKVDVEVPIDLRQAGASWLLSKQSGEVIFSGVLTPGMLTVNKSGTTWSFKDLNVLRHGGRGVARAEVKVSKDRKTYSYKISAYGDYSKATDPQMALQFYMGQRSAYMEQGTWTPLALNKGWKSPPPTP